MKILQDQKQSDVSGKSSKKVCKHVDFEQCEEIKYYVLDSKQGIGVIRKPVEILLKRIREKSY
jgi:hypothetical protein